MEEIVVESARSAQRIAAETGKIENNHDSEMEECLARLKVWQVENLLAPHGMDMFVNDIVRPMETI